MHLDLSTRSDVRYLRAQWDPGRWSTGKGKMLFRLYLFMQAQDRQFAPQVRRIESRVYS